MSAALRYFALPTEPCADVARDVPHWAHVHTPDGGAKSVCAAVRPHSVPLGEELPGMWEQADLTGGQTDTEERS